jgi:hypothetical protein
MRRALWLLLLAGCSHRFPPQYDLAALRADSAKWPGEALGHYLSRPSADVASACVARHFVRTDAALVVPFAAALERDDVPRERWAACAKALLPGLPVEQRLQFAEELARVVPELVERADLPRLRATYAVLIDRPRDDSPALKQLGARDLPSPRAAVRAQVDEIRALLALEAGALNGQPLTEALVLQLDDEGLLRRIAARAPLEALRDGARRRVVRLHIAQSAMREVKQRADAVEAAVFRTGRWAQPLASLATPAPQPPGMLPVEVRFTQDIGAQLAFPFLSDDEARRAPAIDLRPYLRFHVGWSEPLGLCDEPEALSVAPCVDARDVKLGTGFASLDERGTLHVLAKWAMADAIDLTRAGLGLVVPVLLGERPSQVLQLPLTAQTPKQFCFEAPMTERGPQVNATVVAVTQGLLVEAVDELSHRVQFVVPRAAKGFEFGSCGGHGAPGAQGSRGQNGSTGTQGMNASCPSTPGGRGGNGGNGTAGGQGGDGGPGGDGGAVRVELHCGSPCADEALVRAVFRSRGGRGGAAGQGGAGGSGGAGGAGGSGMSCYQNGKTTYAAAGSAGSRGSDGARGSDGKPGRDGLDGPVQVLVR